jgi:hypothetical protein
MTKEFIMSTEHIAHAHALAAINQKVLADGESLPQVTLRNGVRVQTGTVATMLHNIVRYNAGERGAVEVELELAIPTLFQVGLFDLFAAQEWILGDNPGRRFVGMKALEYLPADGRHRDHIAEHARSD